MPLSTDIKVMIELLKDPTGANLSMIETLLKKWDEVNDRFYNQPAERLPLRIREKCPCYQSAERNRGMVKDSGSNDACFGCRLAGWHRGEACDHSDRFGCEEE